MENITKAFTNFFNNFSSPLYVIALTLSVILFAVLYYFVISFLVKNNSKILVLVFSVLMILSAAIILFLGNVKGIVYLAIPSLFLILIIILYSVEIKRIIIAKSSGVNSPEYKHGSKVFDEEEIENCISSITKSLINMSKNDTGAIIILASNNIPSQIIDSGVKLNSKISSELIESVFFPKTPLHDGAMIINDTNIVAAGCFLPLTQNIDNIPKDLGTRHRAGIGITENIDVISLIVSEENGIISIVKAGKITRYADAELIKKTLKEYYWQTITSSKR